MAYLLVNLKFCQRVDFITRVTLFCAFCFRSLGFQQQSLGKNIRHGFHVYVQTRERD